MKIQLKPDAQGGGREARRRKEEGGEKEKEGGGREEGSGRKKCRFLFSSSSSLLLLSLLLPILFLLFSLPLPSSLFFLHFLSFLLLLPLLRLFASRNQKFTTFFVMLHQVREKISDHAQKGYLQPLNAAPNFFVTFGGLDCQNSEAGGEQAKQAKPSKESRAERSVAKLSRA